MSMNMPDEYSDMNDDEKNAYGGTMTVSLSTEDWI